MRWIKSKISDLTIINVTCSIAFLLCVILVILFMHGRVLWKWNDYVLNTEIVGHYGDFVGGFIGTFLSVILLYYTFYYQRKELLKNTKVYQTQQLNDDFYHLMSLYQDILSTYTYKIDEEEPLLNGKEAIHAYVDSMRDGFEDTGNGLLRKQAVLAYMSFYAFNRDFAPIYYRTLYRLCESIDGKEKDTEFKNVELIKILRAQLSDSEMVLIRYNAHTRMGRPFQYYVNRFNLLKHLPSLDLFEYKKYRKILDKDEDISSMNIVLVQLRQRMEDILETKSSNYVTLNEFKSAVSISLTTNDNKDTLKLVINREKTNILRPYDPFNCIMKLPPEDILSLFSYFLYDCTILHNFQKYNKRKDIDFGKVKNDIDGKEQFIFKVHNKEYKPINMTWSQYESRYK